MADAFVQLPARSSTARAAAVVRRVMVALFAAIAVAGLLNAFGQAPRTLTASGTEATLRVQAPARVRGGLFFQTRVDVDARTDLEHPKLLLDRGVLEGMQVSSIEPAAPLEGSRDGRVVLDYGPVAAGDRLTVWLQFQVEPTTPGRHRYGIELVDAGRRVARVDQSLGVLP